MKRLICWLLGHAWRFGHRRYLFGGVGGVGAFAECTRCGAVRGTPRDDE